MMYIKEMTLVKKRKKLKGMTLVEVIISMAIFSMLGVILLGIGRVVDNTTRASSKLSKKMTIQAPYAASKSIIKKDTDGDTVMDKFYYEDDAHNEYVVTPDNIEVKVFFGDESNPTKVKVQKFELEADGKTVKRDAEGNPIKDGAPVDEEAMASMDANKYSTKKIVEGKSSIYDPNGPNADLNFQFIEIQD